MTVGKQEMRDIFRAGWHAKESGKDFEIAYQEYVNYVMESRRIATAKRKADELARREAFRKEMRRRNGLT